LIKTLRLSHREKKCPNEHRRVVIYGFKSRFFLIQKKKFHHVRLFTPQKDTT